MDPKQINNKHIWGEEWQWPVVGDCMLAQQTEDDKTEEEIRMEKYIMENILDSSGSSSDTFSQNGAPANTPQSGVVFTFPPPVPSTGWPVGRPAAAPYSYPSSSASVHLPSSSPQHRVASRQACCCSIQLPQQF